MTGSIDDKPLTQQPQIAETRAQGGLHSHNVRIHKRRTSVRLEKEMWHALNDIAASEKCSVHDLCGAVHDLKDAGASFTAALRVFIVEYYRTASRSSPHVTMIRDRLRTPEPPSRQQAAG